ncbi:MAG: acetylhydrolase [Pseudohongiella sp.]|nr:MAG: acetylhydrolase [Pseudohongiella sp.]
MALDPQAKLLLERIEAANAPNYEEVSPEQARIMYDKASEVLKGPNPDMHSIEESSAPGVAGDIPLRIYRPNAKRDLPLLVFYHGGGYVIGSLDSHDIVCRGISLQAECVVIAVDYRLAPEHKYPAAVEDAWSALEWIAQNSDSLGFDAARIAVGGDSAGGNLATVVSLMARDKGLPSLCLQLLIYPGTDLECGYPSHDSFGSDYRLTKSLIGWFMDNYFTPDDNRSHWQASPMNATDHSNVPPAFVLSAGFDPLQDEEFAYSEKLRQAGISVEHSHYEGMIHGFITMPGVLDKANEAISECARQLREAFEQNDTP